ncbi:MAG: GIY-YIG nuclease family protein [Elusimicrobia bacterium]|nr:GIY-YIG nuclease family protein [Elusimicrobiota bacterium]
MRRLRDWSVYIARCADDSLYTGVAKDVSARLAAHNAGRGAAYTRSRRPVRLAYREDGLTRSAALSREAAIKSLPRPEKLSLLKAARAGLAALLVLAAAGRARAVPTFAKENPVVFSSAAPQAVVTSGANLRMYFIRRASQTEVGSALSADGLSWTEDSPAGRLSTTTLPSVSASSITGCGVLALSGGGDRMVYSIVSTTGSYRIHSATSADGVAWANDTGTVLDGGSTPLSSPRLVALNDASWRLYFLAGTPPSVSVETMRSTNQGLNWGSPSVVLSTTAFGLGASVRTDGRVRLYLTQPLVGTSSAGVVASALSTDSSGTSFSFESGLRLSTDAASGTLSDAVPARSTETYRWRLYYEFSPPGAISTGDVHSALTSAPAPASISPGTVLNVSSTQTFTISGEVFSTNPTLSLSLGGTTLSPTSAVTRTDDQTLSATFDLADQSPGLWDLTVTNADGVATTLTGALDVTFPGGSIGMVGNLLRPRLGTPTTIHITTYDAGVVTAKIFTLDGRLVTVLFDGESPKGTLSLTWDGRDAGGSAVASGVYLLHATGPKLNVKGKIVVIR